MPSTSCAMAVGWSPDGSNGRCSRYGLLGKVMVFMVGRVLYGNNEVAKQRDHLVANALAAMQVALVWNLIRPRPTYARLSSPRRTSRVTRQASPLPCRC